MTDEGDYDDQDAGFDLQDKDIHPKRKVYEVEYRVYSPSDIRAYQQRQIDDVSLITHQPPEASAILLRYSRWNKEKLMERYMDEQETFLEDAGLGTSSASKPQIRKVKGFECGICFEDSANTQTFAMKCGHRFCTDCYGHYLYQKIKEEGEAARIRCPGDGCNRIVDARSLDMLVPDAIKER